MKQLFVTFFLTIIFTACITAQPALALEENISVYETPVSIAPKIGIAKRYNLGGIALWRLGVIPGETWDVLQLMVHKN